jgi:flagellar biosynthesis chaperone FliJ
VPEGNGSGRLDRIEANLERLTERFDAMVDHHDREFKQLLTWQVLMQKKMERMAATQEAEQKRLDALSEKTD